MFGKSSNVFETLKLLEVPFPQVNFSAESFEDLGRLDTERLRSSGGLA